MAERDTMIGRVLHGTIEIRRLIGVGGMGKVYEGYQTHLERKVAVKVMTPEHARNPVAADYFIREARSASRLRHPNIIQIIDYGKEDDETLFMAMEFIPGRPLSGVIADDFPLDAGRIVPIMDQALAALEEAHARQVVHRDLKPDNLMIEPTRDGRDFVKVLDFGIAQMKSPNQQAGPLTQQGALVGTPYYMSPEQARGEDVDGRADLFSLGVILYEMLTQKLPFTGGNVPEILINVIRHEPDAPSVVRPKLEIDPHLEAACLRAIKKEPELRYQSASDFRSALAEVGRDGVRDTAPQKQAPRHFIFKRSKSDDDGVHDSVEAASVSSKTKASTSSPPSEDALPSEADFGDSGSHVIDMSALLTISEASEGEADPAAKKEGGGAVADASATPRDTEQSLLASLFADAGSDSRPSTGPTATVAGMDLDALRNDLLGERRFVTALVVHQRSQRRIDPEDLSELLTAIDAATAEVVKQWEGHVHSRAGALTTIVFGLPKMRPDDGQRAAQAALQLRRALLETAAHAMDFGFALAQGEIFCPSGVLSRAAGAPLDEAGELARLAGEGEVLAAGDTLEGQLAGSFQLGSTGTHGARAIKGLADSAPAQRSRAFELVGRDAELARLLAILGRLARGEGSLLAVTGEPGMGKSALIEEAIRLAEQRGAQVLHARPRWPGVEGVRDIQRQWLLDLARAYGRRPEDMELVMREVGMGAEYSRVLCGLARNRMDEVFGFAGSSRWANAEMDGAAVVSAAIRALVSRLANERPLVLMVDQIDDYDDDLAAFFSGWASFAAQRKLWVMAGVRVYPGRSFPDFPGDAEIIHADPLDEASARAFLKVRLPRTATDGLIDRVVTLSAGVPLQLEELARMAQDRASQGEELTEERAAAWLGEISQIQDVLRLRLFDQEKNVRNVLAVLSVLGDGIRTSELLELCSPDWQPEKAVESLYVQGLIDAQGDEQDPELHFVPPIFRDVAYEQLSRKIRAQIHQRAATRIAGRVGSDPLSADREDLLALARHLEAFGDGRGALKVVGALVERAIRSFELHAAEVHLAEAIRVAEKLHGPWSKHAVRFKLMRIRIFESMGRTDEAIDLARALDHAKDLDPGQAVEARLELAALWLTEEDPELVEQVVRRALEAACELHGKRPTDAEGAGMVVRATQILAQSLEKQGKMVPAADVALRAVELGQGIDLQGNPWGPRMIWEPLNQLGRLRMRAGEIKGASQLFEQALRVCDQAGDPRGELAVRANLSALFAQQDRIDAALRMLQTATRLAQSISDVRATAKLAYNRGLMLMRQRRLEPAHDAFSEALEIAEGLDWREGIAMASSQLQHLDQELDRDEERVDSHGFSGVLKK